MSHLIAALPTIEPLDAYITAGLYDVPSAITLKKQLANTKAQCKRAKGYWDGSYCQFYGTAGSPSVYTAQQQCPYGQALQYVPKSKAYKCVKTKTVQALPAQYWTPQDLWYTGAGGYTGTAGGVVQSYAPSAQEDVIDTSYFDWLPW